jgi:transposase
MGGRIPKGITTEAFAVKAKDHVPEILKPALVPVMEVIQDLTRKIHEYDRWLKEAADRYPQTQAVQQVPGVGPVTSLAFVLTVSDPKRFEKSRDVGAYFGLVPKRDQSGDQDPHLGITKTGNGLVRRLLVGSAQYILGPFGPDSELRRGGLKLAGRGEKGSKSKAAKNKAVTAVARKLAVLLHHLWVSGERYEPFKEAQRKHRLESLSEPAAPARSAR